LVICEGAESYHFIWDESGNTGEWTGPDYIKYGVHEFFDPTIGYYVPGTDKVVLYNEDDLAYKYNYDEDNSPVIETGLKICSCGETSVPEPLPPQSEELECVGFVPDVAFYNGYDGLVYAWKGNKYYTSEDGIHFTSGPHYLTVMGHTVTPTVGYYYDFSNGLRGVDVWEEDDIYVFDGNSWSGPHHQWLDGHNLNPDIGYSLPFISGLQGYGFLGDGVELWEGSNIYVFTGDEWIGPQQLQKSPIVVIPEHYSKEFSATAEDFDGDILTYRWYLDGSLRYTETRYPEQESSWTYTPGGTESGAHTVLVVVSDGEDSDSYNWNVEVRDMHFMVYEPLNEPLEGSGETTPGEMNFTPLGQQTSTSDYKFTEFGSRNSNLETHEAPKSRNRPQTNFQILGGEDQEPNEAPVGLLQKIVGLLMPA